MSETVVRSVDDAAISDLRPILVPVDYSSCSRAALVWASQFAGIVKAPLLILHVIHETGGHPGFYRKNGSDGMMRPIEDIARDMLDDFLREVYPDAAPQPAAGIRTLLVSGLPSSRIVEIAALEEAALIIMGTHG
jgi:nucleotide-binding universal stress UspA family protein